MTILLVSRLFWSVVAYLVGEQQRPRQPQQHYILQAWSMFLLAQDVWLVGDMSKWRRSPLMRLWLLWSSMRRSSLLAVTP